MNAPGQPNVVVIGNTIWENRFARDPAIIGRVVRVNGDPATIIGVMPKGFAFPVRQDIWVPLRLNPLEIPRGEGHDSRYLVDFVPVCHSIAPTRTWRR
jgi:hypothetical protein